MNPEKKVRFPKNLLEMMTIEQTIFTPADQTIGIAILSEIMNIQHIIHIYQLGLSPTKNEYHILQELVAFSFHNRDDVDDFLKRLPNMGALEILLMLNPLPPTPVNE